MDLKKKIFIFNPDTDFAQADPFANYTPNAKIRAFRRRMALVQSEIASPGDMILLLDGQTDVEMTSLPHYSAFSQKGLSAIRPDEIKHIDYGIYGFTPRGWNQTLRRRLIKHGAVSSNLPSEESLDRLRELTHRRTTIHFHNELRSLGIHSGISSPYEFTDLTSLEAWLRRFPESFLKAPWSSSGRGIMPTLGQPLPLMLQWAKGIIARQGSVMAERAMDKTLDFATEWECRNDKTIFSGYSVFSTSGRSVYKGNVGADDGSLRQIICQHINEPLDRIVECQRKTINKLIAPFYSGPLGIDMLADRQGNVNACIELNIRMTMGHIALKKPVCPSSVF